MTEEGVRKLAQVAAGLVVTAASILLTLAALEIGLRVFQPGPPTKIPPQTEWVYVPLDTAHGRDADYVYLEPKRLMHTMEADVSSNALGLRNREVEVEKPPNRYRILTLGDSHTFGAGVREEQTWPRQLERDLQDSGKTDIEVINGGMPSLATEQEIALLRDHLLGLKPDLVIVAYYWNDMPIAGDPLAAWDTADELTPPSTRPRQRSALSSAGSDDDGLLATAKEALRSSYLAYWLVQRVPALFRRVHSDDESKWRSAALTGQTSPRIAASWRFVERKLVELDQLGREAGFALVIVCVPLFEQMTSDAFPNARYQTELARIAAAHDLRLVDPLMAIRAVNPSYPKDFVPFDGHPTGRIYGVIADQLAEAVRGLPRRPPLLAEPPKPS